MKKNRLSFLIVSSLLALSALVGCNSNSEPSNESKAGDSNIQNTSAIQGSDSNGQSASSNGGQNLSSNGGEQGSSNAGGNSSSNNSSSQGGGQQTKTDWTDAEKQTMSSHLYGLVLPFVEMDVTVKYEERQKSVFIQSTANMAAGFLASYAQKFTGWEGGDVSSEAGLSNGCVYAFQKAATVNGAKRYVSVMFAGVNVNSSGEPTGYNQTGKFYLQATDPYEYSFPKQFIDTWLQQQFGTNIGVPAFNADYYNLDQTGVLIAGSATNLEESYKATLLATNEFTIDPERNAQGYIVARPSDGKYILLFKYDATNKVMILTVDAPRGWNAAAINAVFAKHNATAFDLPAINDQNITFGVDDTESGGVDWVTISAGGVTAQMVQDYINALKALNYKVMTVVEGSYIVNVFTNDGMYTLYLTYTPNSSPALLQIQFQLVMNTSVFKAWPAALIARYLDVETDVAPAFAGNAYGYSASINQGGYYRVVVHVDEGTENAAKDSYISTLTVDNGYTPDGYFMNTNIPQYKSANNQIHIAVSSDPTNFAGEINILMEAIVIVDTPWPTDEIAAAISGLFAMNPITESVPALDVSDASDCYVNNNYGGEKFEIVIDGLAASMSEFIGDFKTAGWTEDPYYGFDTTCGQYGALVSPDKQLVAYFDTYSNDLSIYVKSYYEQSYYTWPAQELSQILNKWSVKFDALPAFNYANYVDAQESGSGQEATILVYVGDSLKQRVITDYCIALEAIGYHYDEILGGHISNNHELFIKFETDANGVRIIVSCVKIVYKVVGLNNQWDFADGQLMVDDPDPDYKEQYSASFHVDAGAEFKVLDSENSWFGAKKAQTNSSSVDLSGDNIHINDAGTVTLYFKIFDDDSKLMWIGFQADPVAATWPTAGINAVLEEWSVDDEIPSITDPSVSAIDLQVADSGKQFTITLVGGAGLLGQYNLLLGEYNSEKEGYVSDSGKLVIKTHANGGDLEIVVQLLEEEPELVPWPSAQINAILEAWGVDDKIPELQDECITDITFEYNDVDENFTIAVIGGASLAERYEELMEASYEYDFGEDWWVPDSNKIVVNCGPFGEDFYIEVGLRNSVVVPWPGEALEDFFGDEYTFPVLDLNASYNDYTESDDPIKSVSMNVAIIDGDLDDAIALLRNTYSYDLTGLDGVFTLTCNNMPTYVISSVTAHSFVLTITVPEVDGPIYRVVGSFNSWLYDNGETLDKVLEPEEGYSAQYTVSFYVNLGDEFKVTNNTDDPWLGFDDLETNANFGTNGDGNIIAKHSGYVDLTLNILTNGEKEIIINFDADDEQPTEVTYTFIPDDDWASLTADNAVFYAYVWGDGYTGPQWIKLSIDWDNNCFYLEDFPLGSGAEHFIIVRMNPDCEEDGNEPGWGYKWNQTDDWDFPEAGITFHVNVLKN